RSCHDIALERASGAVKGAEVEEMCRDSEAESDCRPSLVNEIATESVANLSDFVRQMQCWKELLKPAGFCSRHRSKQTQEADGEQNNCQLEKSCRRGCSSQPMETRCGDHSSQDYEREQSQDTIHHHSKHRVGFPFGLSFYEIEDLHRIASDETRSKERKKD